MCRNTGKISVYVDSSDDCTSTESTHRIKTPLSPSGILLVQLEFRTRSIDNHAFVQGFVECAARADPGLFDQA